MLEFYEVFDLFTEAENVERFNFGRPNPNPDPTASLPYAARKRAMSDGGYERSRINPEGAPEMAPDRGYAREAKPQDVAYTGDHRSDLSQQMTPGSKAALKIDVLQKLGGRSYPNATALAEMLSGMTQLPPQAVLAGLMELQKAAPHLFNIDKGTGQITINKMGTNDQEDALGGRYKSNAMQTGVKPQQQTSQYTPEESRVIQQINATKKKLEAQRELGNTDNVGKLAREIAQQLIGIVQDPSARYSRGLKEKAAVMLSQMKTKFLDPMKLPIV